MAYTNIPTEWQQQFSGLDKNSVLDLQTNIGHIEKQLIKKISPGNIVTYGNVDQKTRTIPPGKLIKPQVNKERGFKIDKTEKPANMIVKDIDRELDMTVVPGFSQGMQMPKTRHTAVNDVIPKNVINSSHRYKPRPSDVSQLNGLTRVEPRKALRKTPIIDGARLITNYTPLPSIDQPTVQIRRTA